MPKDFSWRPGQHCLLRFPDLAALGNHPFTIASACIENSHVGEKEGSGNPLTFYIRSQAGFTRKLAAYAGQSPEATASAWVEGPYGGLSYPVENSYDNIILVSGGGGVTACLPWAELLVNNYSKGIKMRTTAVKFIWVVRAAEYLHWITDRLQELQTIAREGRGFFEIELFVTNHLHEEDSVELSNPLTPLSPLSPPSSPAGLYRASNASTENLIGATKKKHPNYETGRPPIKDLLPDLIAPRGKTFVIGENSHPTQYLLLC